MKNILVIGSINMDMVINTNRLPNLGETIEGYGFETVPGGKGANQALAAAKLNGNVRMLGAVGNDIYADYLIENLKNNGVDITRIEKMDDNTGIAVITVCGGDNHIILDGGANKKLTQEVIEKNIDLIEWADLVVFQLEIPQDSILYAAKIAKELNTKVLLNPAPMQTINKEIIELVDIIIPNKNEAEQYLNITINDMTDAYAAVKKFLKMGIKQVIITLGKDGCVYNDKNIIKTQKAINVDVVDTTAAGDSFIGGFCVALCEGKTVEQAIKFATSVSALVVSKKGASTSLPERNEVEKLKIIL